MPNLAKKRPRPKAPPGTAKKFVYGVVGEPAVIGADQSYLDRQLERANQYRNSLASLEWQRRHEWNEAIERANESLLPLKAEQDAAEAEFDAAIQEMKDWQAAESLRLGKKGVSRKTCKEKNPHIDARIQAAEARRTAARAAFKAGKKAAALPDEVKEELTARHSERVRAVRPGYSSTWGTDQQLYSGTYLLVERAAGSFGKGTPPNTDKRNLSGSVGCQIQDGLSEAGMLECQSPLLQLNLPTDPFMYMTRGERRRHNKGKVRVRIGTDQKTKQPIWGEARIAYHRPLPPGAVIKWAELHYEKVGRRRVWTLALSVSCSGGFSKPVGDGYCAVDIGFRTMSGKLPAETKAGGLRFACILADRDLTDVLEGMKKITGFSGHLFDDGRGLDCRLSDRLVNEFKNVRIQQQRRDEEFNLAQSQLVEWLKANSGSIWLSEQCSTLHAWKSPQRLARLVYEWASMRFTGDEEIFPTLRAWRKHEMHLFEHEKNLRDQVSRRRDEVYRVLAAKLRQTCYAVAVEDLDLREWHKNSEAGDNDLNSAAKVNMSIAALSHLISALKNNMEVCRRPAAGTTQTCHECGGKNIVTRDLLQDCDNCHVTSDRDKRSARNMLAEFGAYLRERRDGDRKAA